MSLSLPEKVPPHLTATISRRTLLPDAISGPATHGGFIPSIEGLRALAVLVVLLFHLDIPGFSAGYLGVDLFFVISGFIITRNILFDLHGDRFSLKGFYVRRFRRLFPALLVTVLLTLLVAVLVLPPMELAKTARSSIFALFSLANINFWWESGYFDAVASSKPLLHMWSLSVEEQFYLFWPVLLLILATSRRRLMITCVFLVLSLSASLVLRNDMPSGIFYLLPFRVHQLMAGALVAMLTLRLTATSINVSTLLASIGFILVTVFMAGRFSPAVGAGVVTVLGFLLLLGRESSLAQVLYANRPMQWIGARSYALYLVHWPIIVLFKYGTNFELDMPARLLLLVLSAGAAILLHELVEKPFRKKGEDTTRAQKMAVPATASLLLVTVLVAGTLWQFDGLPSRIDVRIQKIVDSVDAEENLRKGVIRFGRCNLHKMHQFSDYDAETCATIDPQRKNVLILGDSMAADTYMMLSQTYPDIHFSQATAGACPAILHITHDAGQYSACQALNRYRFSELVGLNADLVVLASIWNDKRIPHLKETVDYLQSRGKKVLVIGPRAVFPGSVPLLASRQSSFHTINARLRDLVDMKAALLGRMREAMPNVQIVDIAAMQCTPHCDVIEGDRLLYFDTQHFTPLGAKRVGEQFGQMFDLPTLLSR